MLKLYRAERADTLVSALSALLRSPLSDPFAREIVAVPAKVWSAGSTSSFPPDWALRRSLAGWHRCQHQFPSPIRLVADVLAVVSGVGADNDPWAPTRLVWTVLGAIDDSIDEPWCGVLAKHHRGLGVGRRFASASHITDLFSSYAAQRPQMLIEWAAGRFTDGHGLPLADDFEWQAKLWTVVAERIDVPGPATRLMSVCSRLKDDATVISLPERISVFGPTRLPVDQRMILDAVATHRDVHIWLPHPSPALWEEMNTQLSSG